MIQTQDTEVLNACLTVLRTVKQIVGKYAENRDQFRQAIEVLEDEVIIRRTEVEDQLTNKGITQQPVKPA